MRLVGQQCKQDQVCILHEHSTQERVTESQAESNTLSARSYCNPCDSTGKSLPMKVLRKLNYARGVLQENVQASHMQAAIKGTLETQLPRFIATTHAQAAA